MLVDFLNETREPGEPEVSLGPPGHRTPAMIDAGATAFRACMPKVTGRRNTQAYIACVAVGVQRRYLSGSESKALLYTAQLALAAYPHRRSSRGRKANP